ncbi:hypothetical protein ACFOUP_01720 [Belliella kenyensis]|uniref:Lipoprotein n=1 Tax=Belliella kenyensis TaxID=1472724 RepID=A0ABV8EJ05_9BACT|nr:hypothetical protein [Belliella kenyensis]MCH7401087.1 hypothetical protein [Belliella kenyensis]MDN3604084.1 hypothetical protein [Belliella kenyensis]
MKISLLYFVLAFLLLAACTSSSEQFASEVLKEALSTHDPSKAWLNKEALKINTVTVHFDTDGNILNSQENQLEFRLKPFFEGSNKWEKDSLIHKVTFDGLVTSYKMGQNEVLNKGFLKNKHDELLSAYMDIAFPLNHKDVVKSISFLNKSKILGNREAEVLELHTKDGRSLEIYILTETNEMIGYKRNTRDSYEVVYSVESDYLEGLLLPKKKEIFAADSLGNHLYLKSTVTYNYLK